MRSAYGFLWRDQRFGRFVLVACVPRVGFFMLPLGLLLYVRAQTGSVATAGLALGAFGLASATQPLRGRLVDRYGRLVVAALGIACAASVLLVAVVGSSAAALIGTCVLVGLTLPPTGAFTRTVITAALRDDPLQLRRAYAADSALTEVSLVAGPLLVAAAVDVGGARAALVIAALGIEVGAIALSTTAVARDAAIGRDGPREPGLSVTPTDGGRSLIRGVLAATLCLSVALGVIDVAVPIFAARHGSTVDAGLLLGVLAAGTALGALWYGGHHGTMTLERQLALYTAPLVACIAAMTLVAGPLALGALLVVAGIALGPLYVILYGLVEQSASAGDHTRAFSWEVTATNAGAAVGAAIAGVVISRSGLHMAFATAAVAAALGLLVSLVLVLAPTAAPATDGAQS